MTNCNLPNVGQIPNLPLDVVVEELQKYSGSQFDPGCVDVCLRLIEREGASFVEKDQKFDIDAFLEV